MGRFIRAVLFDLGGTLMQEAGPWGPVRLRADEALVASLRRDGFDLPDGFAAEFRSRLGQYYREREKSLFETTYLSVLGELLSERGYRSVKEPVLRAALDALYEVTQVNWELDQHALLMLRMLESAGYHMGLVSNAGDHKDVLMLARKFNIDRFFDFILTSAACSYRKPHTRIFELALVHWGFAARETAMVGDTLEADILGAKRAGLFSIWYPAHVTNFEAAAEIQPDATVASLLEIPELLARLS